MLIHKYEEKQRSKGSMVCLVDVMRKLRSEMIMIKVVKIRILLQVEREE